MQPRMGALPENSQRRFFSTFVLLFAFPFARTEKENNIVQVGISFQSKGERYLSRMLLIERLSYPSIQKGEENTIRQMVQLQEKVLKSLAQH